ncbi:sugar phosphate isomerase/epimerase [Candidatus Thorarchaeota archaeon]|nr:MAG: sugar phosphate isomerase/epimerase [Candidatus Thorarchaeota archaeon]
MRYGIVPVEFRPAAERVVVDGVPDFSKFDILDIVKQAVNIEHISVIELTLDIEYIIPEALTPSRVDELAELKEELGHSYTAHLPLWSIEPASFNEYVRSGSVESVVHSIELVEPLEPEYYVLHSTGPLAAEFSNLDFPREMVMLICGLMAGFSARSVEEIIAKTEIDPKRLAIENIEFPFEITRELVDEYDTSICFDTGHLLTRYSGDESVSEFYHRHKDRIVELHLHDGSYHEHDGVAVHRDHIALGQGEMPVREFLLELVKDGFQGPLIFELTTPEVMESLAYIAEVVPEALG